MKKESFTLTINLGNAAFDEYPITELARMLRELADALENGEAADGAALFDENGNSVGRYAFNSR